MERRASPVRTCVGCRSRAPTSELLRVVAAEPGILPDPRRRRPGRGAHIHPDPTCLALAERRRAFGRALRMAGVPDTGQLRQYVQAHHPGTTDGGTAHPGPAR